MSEECTTSSSQIRAAGRRWIDGVEVVPFVASQRRARRGEGAPDTGRLALADPNRRALDDGKLRGDVGSGRCVLRKLLGLLQGRVGDDHGQGVAAVVVVPVGKQLGDVEQVAVHLAGVDLGLVARFRHGGNPTPGARRDELNRIP